MSEELEVLITVTRRLRDAGIAYMLTGSMALSYYAVPRMTRDIDVVMELHADDAERIAALFSPDFYVDRDAVAQAIARQSVFNMIHTALVVKVDVVVRKDSEYRRLEFSRRRRISIDGEELWIVAAEDLVISKLEWARTSRSEVQLGDVRSLLASVRDLDHGYLRTWTERLGLGMLYREVTGDRHAG